MGKVILPNIEAAAKEGYETYHFQHNLTWEHAPECERDRWRGIILATIGAYDGD